MKFRLVYFAPLSLILLSFLEPGLIKPMKAKKILEYKEQVFGNGNRSKKLKSSGFEFNKEGDLLQSLQYDYKGDTNGLYRIIYNDKSKPVEFKYYWKNGEWRIQNLTSRGDTVEIATGMDGEVHKHFYVFKQHDITEYGNDKTLFSRPSYKAIYDQGKLMAINYLTNDNIPYTIRYVYKKDESKRNIREKYVIAMVPPIDDGTKETNSPVETVVYTDKNEIIQRVVINGIRDTSFYTYKYEYFK